MLCENDTSYDTITYNREEPLVMALGLLEYSDNSQDYDTSDKTSGKKCYNASNWDKRTKNYQLV